MTKFSERQIRLLFGGIGIGCFALLLALEVLARRTRPRFSILPATR